MFKALIPAVVIASALAAPTFAFAQDGNAPLTRAEVRAQLVQLEKAGYNPASDDTQYPYNIQAAERRVSEQQTVATSFGSPDNGTSVSGTRTTDTGTPAQRVFFGQ
jgi:uncharacterized protein YgbK (DUF1537 family)